MISTGAFLYWQSVPFGESHSENSILGHSDEGGILTGPLGDLLAQD